MKQKRYFITYGSKQFQLQKKHLINLVNRSGYFDHAISMGPEDLSDKFRKTHSDFLTLNRGGGYWIWKYEIIKRLLEKINKNDLVYYSSAGSSFNINGIKRLNEYTQIINDSDSGNLRFSVGHLDVHTNYFLEKKWTTKEIFQYFNVIDNEDITNTKQLIANHFGLIKNDVSLTIFNEFEKLIETNRKLITHDYDEKDQIKDFVENRNDQSILSVLSKIHGTEIIFKDETYFKGIEDDQFLYPFLSVRKRNYTKLEKLKFYFRYRKNINSPIYFGQRQSILKRLIYKFNTLLRS